MSTTGGPQWTKALRKKLHGGRAPHPCDPPGMVPERDAGWQYLVARNRLASAERTALDGDPELVARMHRILQSYEEDPPAALDREVELDRLGLTVHDAAGEESSEDPTRIGALLGLWLDTAGVAFTLELMLSETSFTVRGAFRSGGAEGNSHALTFLPASTGPGMGGPTRLHGSGLGPPAWAALRAWLMVRDGDALRVAIDAAQPLRERLVAATRLQHRDLPIGELDRHAILSSWLSFAFAPHHAWAEEDVRAALERKAGEGGRHVVQPWLVLASLTNVELALAFVREYRGAIAHHIGDYAYDVVESLGTAAAPVLEMLLIDGLRKPERAPIERALKLAVG